MCDPQRNADDAELAKFDDLSRHWWDPEGACRPLHEINPVRLGFVAERTGGLSGLRVLDVGCGGGLLAEAMARQGAQVTGIDLGEGALDVARLHLLESGLEVDYRCIAVEDLAAEQPEPFDVITCMELLEHVPDPRSVVSSCARLLQPGGHLCMATLNRTPKAFALAIVGAEYLLHWLPRGTHQFSRFIRPSELDGWIRDNGLALRGLTGMHYDPLRRRYHLGPGVEVNYLAHAVRED